MTPEDQGAQTAARAVELVGAGEENPRGGGRHNGHQKFPLCRLDPHGRVDKDCAYCRERGRPQEDGASEGGRETSGLFVDRVHR